MEIVKYLSDIMPTVTAEAHCDIPCGIYEPTVAKIAAKTILRMALQIKEFKVPRSVEDNLASVSYINSVARRIAVKEEHAQTCKNELQILWADFFKPEHAEKHPELHNTFWNAMKLCSKNKQEVDTDAANQLIEKVDEIARIFYEVKGVPERYEAYKTLTDKLY